jgi:hypothetical protein
MREMQLGRLAARGRVRQAAGLRNKMPDVDSYDSSSGIGSRCAAKTELCVTLISFEALVSFDSKVFTAYP